MTVHTRGGFFRSIAPYAQAGPPPVTPPGTHRYSVTWVGGGTLPVFAREVDHEIPRDDLSVRLVLVEDAPCPS